MRNKTGFTLIELLVSVALLIITLSIALFATIGVNGSIAKSDSRAIVADASRNVADAIRRNIFNAPPGASVILKAGDIGYAVATINISEDQASRTCTVIGSGYINSSNEYKIEPIPQIADGNKYGVMLKVFRLTADGNCPDDVNSATAYYETMITESAVEAQRLNFDIVSISSSKEQLRYDMILKSLRSGAGRATETRNPSVAVQSSVPVGLVQLPPVPLTITTNLGQLTEAIEYKVPLRVMGQQEGTSLEWTVAFDGLVTENKKLPNQYQEFFNTGCTGASATSFRSAAPGSPTDSKNVTIVTEGGVSYLAGLLGSMNIPKVTTNPATTPNLTPKVILSVVEKKVGTDQNEVVATASRSYVLNVVRNDVRPTIITEQLPEGQVGKPYEIDNLITDASRFPPPNGPQKFEFTKPLLRAVGSVSGHGPSPTEGVSNSGCRYEWSFVKADGTTTFKPSEAGAPPGLQLGGDTNQAGDYYTSSPFPSGSKLRNSGRFLICVTNELCEQPARQVIACDPVNHVKTYTFIVQAKTVVGTANPESFTTRKSFSLKVNPPDPGYVKPAWCPL